MFFFNYKKIFNKYIYINNSIFIKIEGIYNYIRKITLKILYRNHLNIFT